MGFDWTGVLGAVSGLAGGLLSSHSAKKAAQRAADLQLRNWTIMQSNAHQYEVEDLRKAGLNPILSATNGQIASPGAAPVAQDPADWSGAMSTINNAIKNMMWNDIEHGKLENQKLGLELDEQRVKNDSMRVENDAKRVYLEGLKTDSIVKLNLALGLKTQEEANHLKQQILSIKNDMQIRRELADAQKALMEGQKTEAYASAGRASAQMQDALEHAGVNRAQAKILARELQGGKLGSMLPEKMVQSPLQYLADAVKSGADWFNERKKVYDFSVGHSARD